MVQNQIIENVKPTSCLYRQNVKPMKSVKVSYYSLAFNFNDFYVKLCK